MQHSTALTTLIKDRLITRLSMKTRIVVGYNISEEYVTDVEYRGFSEVFLQKEFVHRTRDTGRIYLDYLT